MISSNDQKTDYRLLPWGILREPIKNIKRSDYVIYTKIKNNKIPPIHFEIQPFLNTYPINSTSLSTLMKYDTSGYRKSLPPDQHIFAFCGIADPNSFVNSISELSLKVKGRRFFQDHQDYTDTIIQELSNQIKSNYINHVVTTEKDMVKIPGDFISEYDFYVIKIEVVFENDAEIIDLIKPILLS